MLYEQFDGKIFMNWQREIIFDIFEVGYYLSEDKLVNHVGSNDVFILALVKVWIHDMIIRVNGWY